jgi:hypothetical protein
MHAGQGRALAGSASKPLKQLLGAVSFRAFAAGPALPSLAIFRLNNA